jgi:UDP-N-acetylmuramate dehydrogenase
MIAALDAWRLHGAGYPLCVLGRGSNVLFSDRGFHGMVLLTAGVQDVTFPDNPVSCPVPAKGAADGPSEEARNDPGRDMPYGGEPLLIQADCGASLTGLAAACVQEGRSLSGLEFAYGIPGSLGGAVVMNAGAFGGEMSQVVCGSDYYDTGTGAIRHLPAGDHGFSYRHSVYLDRPDRILLGATLSLRQAPLTQIQSAMEQNMTARRENQPLNFSSAGSVFKRPEEPGMYVGRMVESCGLKGLSVGGAVVSEKHGGFIVNTGEASAADVLAVIDKVQKAIFQKFQVTLECEIRLMGDR